MRKDSREDKAYQYLLLFSVCLCLAIAASVFVISYKKDNGKTFAGHFKPTSQKSFKSFEIEAVKIDHDKPAAITANRDHKKRLTNANTVCNRKTTPKQKSRRVNPQSREYDTIYSWIDENGVKHYGNSKPKKTDNYQVRRMEKSKSKPIPKQKVLDKNYSLPNYTYAQSSFKTQNYKNVYNPQTDEFGVTRNELMEQIEEENEKLEIYKDRLSEERKELFDIKRKPYKPRESKWKRQRIADQERVVDRYEQLIEDVRARIREKELAVAHRKYDAR